MDIAAWLGGLGLARYEKAFIDNDIDPDLLRSLTADDLRDLGIVSIGHRRRLLDAIAALDEASAATTAKSPTITGTAAAPSVEAAERRQLTVMFCDLVGSTELSARLDPEDLRDVIAAYHRAVADVVRSFDGFVAKYMGDGVLAYFGYPRAHEDDAERAVRSGLRCIEAVACLDVKSIELKVRTGIATGLVVVGDLIGEGSAQEQSVVGETPNLAARLQALAEPGAVVIATGTRRLVGDLFEYRDLGAIEVKGIAAPVPAWQVLRVSGVESRFEALRGSALVPLVGRDEEIDLLLRRWARAKAGDGQVVLLSGEPGIGKSRITAELAGRLEAEPHIRLRFFCSPYHRDSALFPFVDQLGRAAEFGRDDPPAARLEKLKAVLALAAPPNEDVALVADLMSLPAPECTPLPNLSSQRKRERTLEALIRQVEGLVRQRPVLMVFEDVHWIDPTSRELLDLIVERVRALPALLIVTFRPEFQPSWIGQPQITMLALSRLDRHDRSALAVQIAGGKRLPDEVAAQIAERADGVPLFVEELTKSVLESGLLREETNRYVLDGVLPALAIPTTLHDSLLARLDRLDSVRLVAQIGAAIGREFPYRLLRAASRLPEEELQASLARLVASELVFQRGQPPDAVYSFKHALVQDAAHSSLLRSSRQQLHAQIAKALEAQSPELIEGQPELLAQHYEEAGLVEEAVAYWGRAGQRSAVRSAMPEAVSQFQKALDQLALLTDSPERQRQELEFNSALGAALMVVRGLAAPETGRAYDRAQELWEQLGSPSEFLLIPYARSIYHGTRGEIDLALRLDENLLCLSRLRDDSAGLVLSHVSSGRNLMHAGRLAASRSHVDEALALYDPDLHGWLAHQTGLNPRAVAQPHLGIVLLCLGFPDQALEQSNAAVAEAQRLAHFPSLAAAWHMNAVLLSLLGNEVALKESATQLITVSTEQSFPLYRSYGTFFSGWVKVKSGDVAGGISLLRSGVAAYRATGAELWMPYHLALVASACELMDRIEEGLALLGEAFQITERTATRWFAAELNRLKGQLLLRQGQSKAAEELYFNALSIAGEQEAKFWGLRAAESIARLWRDQGRQAEARALLTPVYGWFTEGFDTPHLKEAKALLDQLSG